MNLNKLSNQELIDIYYGESLIRAKAKIELNKRGLYEEKGDFGKRLIKTGKNIEIFLKDVGFSYFASLPRKENQASGCCEYHLPIDKNRLFQINGLGLSEIESLKDPVEFSIQNTDTMMGEYNKEYPDFEAMVNGEKDKVDFSVGFKRWEL